MISSNKTKYSIACPNEIVEIGMVVSKEQVFNQPVALYISEWQTVSGFQVVLLNWKSIVALTSH